MARSTTRSASESISISDAATVHAFNSRSTADSVGIETAVVHGSTMRQAADSIRVEDAATVLVGAGPIAVRASSSATISIEPREGSQIPRVDAGLAKNQWDLALIGTGFSVGYAVGHLPGATVGSLALYGWGQWRWRSRER